MQTLRQAVASALGGIFPALSPTPAPLLSLRLFASPAGGAQQLSGQLPAKLQLAQGPADGDDDGTHAWVAWAFTPLASGGGGGGSPAQQHLCVLRLSLQQGGATAAQQVPRRCPQHATLPINCSAPHVLDSLNARTRSAGCSIVVA